MPLTAWLSNGVANPEVRANASLEPTQVSRQPHISHEFVCLLFFPTHTAINWCHVLILHGTAGKLTPKSRRPTTTTGGLSHPPIFHIILLFTRTIQKMLLRNFQLQGSRQSMHIYDLYQGVKLSRFIPWSKWLLMRGIAAKILIIIIYIIIIIIFNKKQ